MPKAVLTFHRYNRCVLCFSCSHLCVSGPNRAYPLLPWWRTRWHWQGAGAGWGRGTTDTKNYLEVRKQKSKDGPGTHQSQ